MASTTLISKTTLGTLCPQPFAPAKARGPSKDQLRRRSCCLSNSPSPKDKPPLSPPHPLPAPLVPIQPSPTQLKPDLNPSPIRFTRRLGLLGGAGIGISTLFHSWLGPSLPRSHTATEGATISSEMVESPALWLDTPASHERWLAWLACKSKAMAAGEQVWLLSTLCHENLQGRHPLGPIDHRQDLIAFQKSLQRLMPPQQVVVEQAWLGQHHACFLGQLVFSLPLGGTLGLPFALYVVMIDGRIGWWQESWDVLHGQIQWLDRHLGRRQAKPFPPEKIQAFVQTQQELLAKGADCVRQDDG